MSPSYELPEFSRHVVTAVLVAHDGARWLPRTLEGLRGQSRPPQRTIGVDTGSRDNTQALLAEALGMDSVVTRGRGTGFSAAIAYALNAYAGEYVVPSAVADAHLSTEIVEWVWLLHDDSEPAPDALYHLLSVVEERPSVAVVGPKIRGWYDRRQLLEVGVSIAPNGRRDTGVDRREQDQGQHDGIRDVLAVNSAGMLVRRDVWDRLLGFDRTITLMHDDIDFGWRANAAGYEVVVNADAVMYHAEAVTRERRPVDTTISRAHFADRANGMYVLLVNMRARSVPFALLRLGIGAVLRALGMLIAKLPGHAADEMLALLAVYSRPDRLIGGRRRRRRTRKLANSELRHLFPPRGSQMRQLVENLAGMLGSNRRAESLSASVGRHRAIETGPTAEEPEDVVGDGIAAIRRFFQRPGVLIMIGLSVVALAAFRGLIGGGRLMGGALLPAPASAASLWQTYATSWHPVGLGGSADAPPYLVVVAGLGSLLFGQASLAVDLLFFGCIPLAGLTAYLAASRVVRARALRVWAAVAYALLPATTGALAGGRLGTMVGIVLLPLLGIGAARVIGTPGRPGTMRATWATGLLLAVATAFVPLAWVLAVLLTVVAGFTVARTGPALRRLLVVLAMPILVLLPWSLSLLRHPSTLLLEAGLPGPGLADLRLDPAALVLLHPGGPGMYPLWISAGLVLAALAALLRPSRQEVVLAGWALGLVGFLVAVAMSRIDVKGPMMSASAPAWPGFATAVMGAGLILAALIGAEGARSRLAASSFGWRQPLSVGVTALAGITPLVAGAWWVAQGAGDPLERRNPVVLPAYVAAEGETPDRPRTLVLRSSSGGALSYAVLRDVGPRLGDGDTSPDSGKHAQLDQIVASLGSGQAGEDVGKLVDYAIQYVLVARPVDPELARILDGVPGLSRVSAPDGTGLWRLPSSAARLRLISADGKQNLALPSGAIDVKTQIPAGSGSRQLALAESADSRWHASLNGEELEGKTINGWEQAFDVPAEGGLLEVWHDGAVRTGWLFAQGLIALVGVVLVLPGGRRREDDEEIVHDVVPLPGPRSRRGTGADAVPVAEPTAEPVDWMAEPMADGMAGAPDWAPGPVTGGGPQPEPQPEPFPEPQPEPHTGRWDYLTEPDYGRPWHTEQQPEQPEPEPEWRRDTWQPQGEWNPEPAPTWSPEPATTWPQTDEWRPEPAPEWQPELQPKPEWRSGSGWEDGRDEREPQPPPKRRHGRYPPHDLPPDPGRPSGTGGGS